MSIKIVCCRRLVLEFAENHDRNHMSRVALQRTGNSFMRSKLRSSGTTCVGKGKQLSGRDIQNVPPQKRGRRSCSSPACNISNALYLHEETGLRWCASHKPGAGCVRRNNKGTSGRLSECCEFVNEEGQRCRIRSVFGPPGGRAVRCKTHSVDGYERVNALKCCVCKLFAVRKRGVMCIACRRGRGLIHREELRVELILRCTSLWSHLSYRDSTVASKCDVNDKPWLYRPDFVWIVCDSLAIILEVDEYDHSGPGYNDICEEARMIRLQETMDLNTIFVRYDPHQGRSTGANPEWMVSSKHWRSPRACSPDELKAFRGTYSSTLIQLQQRRLTEKNLARLFAEPTLTDQSPCPVEVKLVRMLERLVQRHLESEHRDLIPPLQVLRV